MPIAIILFFVVIVLTIVFVKAFNDLYEEVSTLRFGRREANSRINFLEERSHRLEDTITSIRSRNRALEEMLNITYKGQETLPAKYVKNK